jgi:hypothetical protein
VENRFLAMSAKQEIDAIQHVFADVYETDTDLGTLVRRSVEGFGSEDRMWQVMDAHGSGGARALLQFLADVPTKLGRTSGQFTGGFTPEISVVPEALATWNAFLSEAFELAMINIDKEERARIPEVWERLRILIRDASVFASPRIRAWSPPGQKS